MDKAQIKLGIVGAGGKMGREIAEFALKDSDFIEIQLFENPEYPQEKLDIYDHSKNSFVTFELSNNINNCKCIIVDHKTYSNTSKMAY